MKLNEINEEYEKHGRISRLSIERLRECLLGADPYEAITVATDCAVFELIPEIASLLDSTDPMVRWNAVGSIHTRFRVTDHIEKTLEMALRDENTIVKAIALVGLGEVLPKLKDRAFQQRIACVLNTTLISEEVYEDVRAAAYEGILAAMDVMPLLRPPASMPLRFPEDVDAKIVQGFANRYL